MDSKHKSQEQLMQEAKEDAKKRWLNNMVTGAFTKNSPTNKK